MGMNNIYDYPKQVIKTQRELHTRLLLIAVGAWGRGAQPWTMHGSICFFLFYLETLAIAHYKNQWGLSGVVGFFHGNIHAGASGSLLSYDHGAFSAHTLIALLHYIFGD